MQHDLTFSVECPAPDVGVGDEVAHFYFGQLLAGMVSQPSYLHHRPLHYT
jgi:hypothetical protein